MAKMEFLFDLVTNYQVLRKLFNEADAQNTGELEPEQLRKVHSSIRPGGVSLRQTRAAINEICACETCDVSEFFDVLNEMDRRYYLVKDLQWEFAMLDGKERGTINEKDARFLFQAVYDEFFSHRRWLEFLRSRPVPGTGISFAEIEVALCNIPSSEWLEQDSREEERQREELIKAQQTKLVEEEQKMKKEKEVRKLEKDTEETRRRKEKEKNVDRQNKLKEIENKKIKQEKRKKLEEERQKKEVVAKQKQEEDRLREKEEREREEEEKKRMAENSIKKKDEQEANQKWKKEELLHQQEVDRERLEREKAEREMLENAEADEAEEMADAAAEAEEEAVEAARLASVAAQQAKDEVSRQAAKEAEKKALAEAQANKERKLRASLKAAQKSRKVEKLDKSISEAKDAKIPSLKKPITEAMTTRHEVKLGVNLKEACLGRNLERLDEAIKDVKQGGLEDFYKVELVEGEKLANRLRRLERIRKEILELKQSTISEIRSYQNPPPAVHQIMIATYLLLNYKEKPLKEWKNLQALLGKTGNEGLKRQVTSLDPVKVSDSVADFAEQKYLKEHQLDTIRDVSAGAATFYVWATNMIEEARACVEQREKFAEKEAKRSALEDEEHVKAQEKAKARREARQKRQIQRDTKSQHKISSVEKRKTSREGSHELVRKRSSSLEATRKQSRSREASPATTSSGRKLSSERGRVQERRSRSSQNTP